MALYRVFKDGKVKVGTAKVGATASVTASSAPLRRSNKDALAEQFIQEASVRARTGGSRLGMHNSGLRSRCSLFRLIYYM